MRGRPDWHCVIDHILVASGLQLASFPACNTMRGAIDATEPYQVLVRLADARPPDIKVCIVADHGFGDQKLYRILTEDPKFDQVIRLRAKITVTAADGEVRTAAAGVGPSGRARIMRDAPVAAERYQVGTVLCVQGHLGNPGSSAMAARLGSSTSRTTRASSV